MSIKMKKTIVLAVAVGVSTGCSFDPFGSSDDDHPQVSELELLNVSDSKLSRPGAKTTEQVIKNGMLMNHYGYRTQNFSCFNCDLARAEATTDSSSADGGFSSTTTQEQGVDESDRVKYDGNTLYLASNNYGGYYWPADTQQEDDIRNLPHVRVMHRNPDDSLSEHALIALGDGAASVNDLYVHNDTLATIYDVFEYQDGSGNSNNASDAVIDIWFPYEQKFGVDFHNVADTTNVESLGQFKVDGYVLSSRRIDDKVYIVSSYSNYLDTGSIETEQELQAVYEALLEDQDLQLLPYIEIAGESQPLVSLDSCYLPSGSNDTFGYSSVVTLVTFDLNQPQNYQTECVIAPIHGFYASANGMYFFATEYIELDGSDGQTWQPQTVLHHFAFDGNSANYQATGKVNGALGWNNSHLRFSEKDELLRVVTSTQSDFNDFEHKLFVLESDSSSQEMTVISHLPNDLHPEKIGKPGEDVYAVRYFGDKAYVVTFERTDPLYVIDLANPLNPKIEGALEIPGYSAYLQPLNENYVVGVGQQIDPNVADGGGSIDAIEEGAKIELYDVSDPSNPTVAATIVFENQYSPVEWDYHALTQLQLDQDRFKFALPTHGWTEQIVDGGISWDRTYAMQLINIDLSVNEKMTKQGHITVELEEFGSWGDRAVLHGDLVYYVRHNSVWQSFWSTPAVVNGPY